MRHTENSYRVNVFVGENVASAKVAHSYFLTADGNGNIIESTPKITTRYGTLVKGVPLDEVLNAITTQPEARLASEGIGPKNPQSAFRNLQSPHNRPSSARTLLAPARCKRA